jgi:hypothetical protein
VAGSDDSARNRLQRTALAVGVVCLAICALGAMVRPGPFLRFYLVAYSYWLGIALGSMAIVMVYHLTGGRWGYVICRLSEAATRTLPLLVVLFAPILLGMNRLYHWTSAAEVAGDPVLEHKSIYLNVPAFLVRAAIYFAIWLLLAYFLNRWSRRRDESGDPRLPARLRLLSGPGLVLYGLTMTFATVDWVMSLQAHWFSTIFAVVFGVGQVLSALSFAILTLFLLASQPPLSGLISTKVCRDLGNLLLTVVMFWAYTAFAQFLLIWAGNLPDEIAWYLPRFAGGWLWIAVFVILCQFAVPFLLLLFRRTKNDLLHLSWVAALLLATCFVSLFWQIVPAPLPHGVSADGLGLGHGLDVLAAVMALLGVGGVWVAVFLRQLKRMPLVPLRSLGAEEAASHG